MRSSLSRRVPNANPFRQISTSRYRHRSVVGRFASTMAPSTCIVYLPDLPIRRLVLLRVHANAGSLYASLYTYTYGCSFANTVFSPRALALPPDRRPIVISGPSGVGKGTLIRRLFGSHPDTFTLSVSHTTRGPRPGEAHGVDYFYVQMAEFEDLVAADGFVEHAQFGSNRYGTSKATIEEQTAKGKVVVLDIEMEVGIDANARSSGISPSPPRTGYRG